MDREEDILDFIRRCETDLIEAKKEKLELII